MRHALWLLGAIASCAAVTPTPPPPNPAPLRSSEDRSSPAWDAWRAQFRDRIVQARPQLGDCSRLPSSEREACACGLLCHLHFDPLPGGATSFTADWPNGGHLVVEAEGLVSRCGLAPGEPARFTCPPR